MTGCEVNALAQFIYLQLLDVLTTIAFMMQGVGEGNPIVRWAMRATENPFGGLFMLKGAAIALAMLCIYRSRERLLQRVNVLFAAVIVYNLVALILANPMVN